MNQSGKLFGLVGLGLAGLFFGHMAITIAKSGNLLAATPVAGLCLMVIAVLIGVYKGAIR